MEKTIISKCGYLSRIAYGKRVESKVREALRGEGFRVRNASPRQDMRDKVDGFLDGCPMQIKYRDSGNDILVEVVYLDDSHGRAKPTVSPDMQFDGRDMLGRARWYVCLSADGTRIRLCDAHRLRANATSLARQLIEKHSMNNKVMLLRTREGEARITRDHNTGRSKIVFFGQPTIFQNRELRLNRPVYAGV